MAGILIFMAVALALAAFLIFSSLRTYRVEQQELAAARERADQARHDAETARALRAKWEAKIAADTVEIELQRLAAARDPRGPGDGLGSDDVAPVRTGRFRRDAPVPLHVARDRG